MVASGVLPTPPAHDGPTAADDERSAQPLDAVLRLTFDSREAVRDYASSLASLLHGASESCAAADSSGRIRDDLDLCELIQRLANGDRPSSLRFHVRENQVSQDVLVASSGPEVTVKTRLVRAASPTGLLWLQANHQHPGLCPVLALPVCGGSFARAAVRALVGLAARGKGLLEASLQMGGEDASRLAWEVDDCSEEGRDAGSGIRPPTLHVQTPVPSATRLLATEIDPAALNRSPTPAPVEWWAGFDALANNAPRHVAELDRHLRQVVQTSQPWRLTDISAARQAKFMVPAEEGLVMALVPQRDDVVVAVDLRQPRELLQSFLLHALAHLACGHVRPGDKWGHWDTRTTAAGEQPHRHWDREAHAYVARHLRRPVVRQITALDDCTPTEKAQLGLWLMAGEMLGEKRHLHPAAERYQAAAYQRQAAERMAAMLEQYGGAMLCDGVGLGKTYVATTLIVHYANTWRDQWAETPERLVADPFRVTILAPNSVVSTWRREALPTLAAFGVPLAAVRVLSHTKLSRVSKTSAVLEAARGRQSDFEHLLLSDLVIVDEAHNFRSLAARRTKVLRDLLRVQPRLHTRRRVALLTATPVNNSLEDLRQEASLLFCKPLFLSNAKTDDGYRRQAINAVRERCKRARGASGSSDVAGLLIHGHPDERFSDTIEFREDLDFGPNVQRIGDYIKEQDKRLKDLQTRLREAAHDGRPTEQAGHQVRIAEDLLDRVVVQRSRALCKEVERHQQSNVELLFRPDAPPPEKLCYSDEYDGIEDVLARFLPLFDSGPDKRRTSVRPLSLRVYMWYDVAEGFRSPDETSSVVGLQRVLVLKRLESSPVPFLITLLRLTALHAHRLQRLRALCRSADDAAKDRALKAQIDEVLAGQAQAALRKIRALATGEMPTDARSDFVKSLSKAHAADRPAADTDDPFPQLDLFDGPEETAERRVQVDRLWPLRDAILADFGTLLAVTPDLADIVFGQFDAAKWPRRFIAGGEAVDWPISPQWGLRVVTDAKLRRLVGRLIVARRTDQKAIVFSQFSDTIAYIRSVLTAIRTFERQDWQMAIHGLGIPHLKREELVALCDATTAITGSTEDRDDIVNAFAPFYRIGPWQPTGDNVTNAERALLGDSWETAWASAMSRPIDVLLSSDVLAEGVNLQDAALLVNFDVHWNPVRMIQRSGRVDRRLNARIEQQKDFPDLAALAAKLGKTAPSYYWHAHPDEAPETVNMLLPDELEAELQLRERIAVKTMAIDFTLGLEHGTGAEADWMENYRYHGITSLNSLQRDRAIEQLASHHDRLSRLFAELGLQTQWADNLSGWFRAEGADDGSPLVARALIGYQGGELERFTRYLEPAVVEGIPHWFWAEDKPGGSLFDGWLVLDGKTWPPAAPRRYIEWHSDSAIPLSAAHLLAALEWLASGSGVAEWSKTNKGVGRLLLQGASAIAAPKFGVDRDRIRIPTVFVLQLNAFAPQPPVSHSLAQPEPTGPRRGIARACATCGHAPGMHKCCPRCKASADGEAAVERLFGFREIRNARGEPYGIPQPWCRSCRSSALSTPQR